MDSRLLRSYIWFDQDWEERACTACGKTFRARTPDQVHVPAGEPNGIPAVVYYEVTKCPACGGDAPVYCSRIPVRFHKCRGCGYGFKSIERT